MHSYTIIIDDGGGGGGGRVKAKQMGLLGPRVHEKKNSPLGFEADVRGQPTKRAIVVKAYWRGN